MAEIERLRQKRSTKARAITRNHQLLLRVKQTVLDILPDATVILYGSRARGDARPDSDWDFMVLTDVPVTYDLVERARYKIYELSLELDVVISLFMENRLEWFSPLGKVLPLHENIDLEGITL